MLTTSLPTSNCLQRTWKSGRIATHATSKLSMIQTTSIKSRAMQWSPPVCQHQSACQGSQKNWNTIATHTIIKLSRIQTTSIESWPMQCSPPVCQHQTTCWGTWKNWVFCNVHN
jgi:hypothetical protein